MIVPAFAYNGRYVVAVTDRSLVVLQPTTHEKVTEVDIPPPQYRIGCVAFHPKHPHLLFAGSPGGILLFCIDPANIHGGTRFVRVWQPIAHPPMVDPAVIREYGDIGRLQFHPTTGRLAHTLHYRNDKDSVSVSSRDPVMDASSGALYPFDSEPVFVCDGLHDVITCVAFDPYTSAVTSPRLAVTASNSGLIHLVDCGGGGGGGAASHRPRVVAIDVGHKSVVHDVAFFRERETKWTLSDSFAFFSGSADGFLRIYRERGAPRKVESVKLPNLVHDETPTYDDFDEGGGAGGVDLDAEDADELHQKKRNSYEKNRKSLSSHRMIEEPEEGTTIDLTIVRILPDLSDEHNTFYFRTSGTTRFIRYNHAKQTMEYVDRRDYFYDFPYRSADWYLRERPMWIVPGTSTLSFQGFVFTSHGMQPSPIPLQQKVKQPDRYYMTLSTRRPETEISQPHDDEVKIPPFTPDLMVRAPFESVHQHQYGNCAMYAEINNLLLHPVIVSYVKRFYKQVSMERLLDSSAGGRYDGIVTTLRKILDFKFQDPVENPSYGILELKEEMKDLQSLLKCAIRMIPPSATMCRSSEFGYGENDYVGFLRMEALLSFSLPPPIFRMYHTSGSMERIREMRDIIIPRHMPPIERLNQLDLAPFSLLKRKIPHQADDLVSQYTKLLKQRATDATLMKALKEITSTASVVSFELLLETCMKIMSEDWDYSYGFQLFQSDPDPPPIIMFYDAIPINLYLVHERTKQLYELAVSELSRPMHAMSGIYDPIQHRGLYASDPHGLIQETDWRVNPLFGGDPRKKTPMIRKIDEDEGDRGQYRIYHRASTNPGETNEAIQEAIKRRRDHYLATI